MIQNFSRVPSIHIKKNLREEGVLLTIYRLRGECEWGGPAESVSLALHTCSTLTPAPCGNSAVSQIKYTSKGIYEKKRETERGREGEAW